MYIHIYIYREREIYISGKTCLLHGFKMCPHTLRGTSLLLFTALHAGPTNNSIASHKTEVFLAIAMNS